MTRLPPRLQPLWPAIKVAHRGGARVVGSVARRTSTRRGVPTSASTCARETAALEPDGATYRVATPAHQLTKPVPSGSPAGHWFFETVREHEVPETFVLDLAEGTVLGRHAAVVTRGGRLDHETSHYFGTKSWREHPVFLNPAPSRPERVPGTLLALSTRATGDNYYHFLVDALPRLGILADALPGALSEVDAVLIDHHTRYQRELVSLLGLDRWRLYHPRRGLALTADRLLVPSLPNVSTIVAPQTTEWLRETLPPRTTGLPERLYITRGSAPHTRRVVREAELRERLRRRGFTVLDPGSLSVQGQIDHFAAARVIVAPHGAALTNLSFCRPGVRLLELFAPGYLNPGYWSIMSNIDGAHYRYLVAPTPRAARPGSRNLGVMHDIALDPTDVEDALDALLADAEITT